MQHITQAHAENLKPWAGVTRETVHPYGCRACDQAAAVLLACYVNHTSRITRLTLRRIFNTRESCHTCYMLVRRAHAMDEQPHTQARGRARDSH